MAWLRFWGAVLVSELVYKDETAGSGVSLAAAFRHLYEVSAQFGRYHVNNIIGTLPVFGGNVHKDNAFVFDDSAYGFK